MKTYIPAVLTLAAIIAMLEFGGCGKGDSENKELKGGFIGEYNSHPVKILKLDGLNKINIFKDSLMDESIYSIDQNHDGQLDVVSKEYTRDKDLEALANFDSLQKIYSKVMFAYEYPEMKKKYSGCFMLWPDTIIFGKYGGMTGLIDVNRDGTYDIIQYMGNTPGAFEMVFNKEFFNKKQLNYDLLDAEYFSKRVEDAKASGEP